MDRRGWCANRIFWSPRSPNHPEFDVPSGREGIGRRTPMVTVPRYPSLFQINTRVWLERLSREAGKRVTLADIDDATLDGFAEQGFDWIWLLSVWQTGAAGRAVSRS